MYYHVEITIKRSKEEVELILQDLKLRNLRNSRVSPTNPSSILTYGEYLLNLSEEELSNRFIAPYKNNESMFVNGKIIYLENIERIRIHRTESNFSEFKERRKEENFRSSRPVIVDFFYTGEDVTDIFIKEPPGYKKTISKEAMISKPQSNQIFVVHGHENGMKEAVARVLERLDLEPIILHEQADRGATIIEKFEKYSENVSFAVALLSPDDKGYKRDQDPQSASFRARQNVILELGYFIGKLGRENVFALLWPEENFEFPSDIFGRLYTLYDSSGHWKNILAKELKAAGYDIDFKKL